jgi:acyl phosphate:glycerol-3-phosphate acyltransferase
VQHTPAISINAIPIVIVVGAYLLGSIPFGLLLGKLFGREDVRKAGSGNIGATNVARVAGPLAGILTLVLDTAKGAVTVLLAVRLSHDDAFWMMIAALCALVGHCFPIWLGFRGGKGVATAAGVFVVLFPLAVLGATVLFVFVVLFWRFVSLGSISAAAGMPLLIYLLWAPHHAPPFIISFGTLAAAALIIYRHKGNILRLVEGEEPKFTFRRNKDAP